MTKPSSNMKRFYRQRKKNNTSSTTKPPPKSTSWSKKKGPTVIPPEPLDENARMEQVLKQFDMNMTYGPCIGMTRLARWERARRLGLNPPQEIETLLKTTDIKVRQVSLWDGRTYTNTATTKNT
ncbi:hypothetical protein Tsubulata_016129 [Turnera subulata]|uniref:DNA polymerase delta subunit 4 n=1 Tax=Turnera subulata TaxID=218843 RepID=A0A9Q0GGC9_9ROSI|nr:hypothetical protein Tsubulata_016129 [Turnera subulata]